MIPLPQHGDNGIPRLLPARADSIEKIVHILALLSTSPTPVSYEGRIVSPPAGVHTIVVAPSIWKRFTCVEGCAACCYLRVTLDYIPPEWDRVRDMVQAPLFTGRTVTVNGKQYPLYTQDQRGRPLQDRACIFLDPTIRDGTAGCSLWPHAPLSCSSAPQLQYIQARIGQTFVFKRPFGRAWKMHPTPQCQFHPVTDSADSGLQGDIEGLRRFKEYADYFGIETALPQVIQVVEDVYNKKRSIPRKIVTVWEG